MADHEQLIECIDGLSFVVPVGPCEREVNRMELSVGIVMTTIGLTMALIELFFPRLSRRLECALDRTVEILAPFYLVIGSHLGDSMNGYPER